MGQPRPLSAAEVDRRLQKALRQLREAERNAVLWFAEVQKRKLFRDLGFSSVYHYATEALGFSRPRTAQFIRLCDCLDDLPALKGSLASGDVSWTKAREIAKVATPETDRAWVELARRESRRKLERRVRMTQTRSRARRRTRDTQLALAGPGGPCGDGLGAAQFPGGAATPSANGATSVPGGAATPSGNGTGESPGGGAAESLGSAGEFDDETIDAPVSLSLRFTPAQYARYEALMEKLRKQRARGSREDLLLAGLEALLVAGAPESARAAGRRTGSGTTEGPRTSPDAAPVSPGNHRPDYQIVVQQCEDCGRTRIPTSRGAKRVSAAAADAMRCDALVNRPGERNRATIPPAARREVLARDGYRCATPGCGSAHFLEVHHLVPRAMGGSNKRENLVTLCSACHRLAHDGHGDRFRRARLENGPGNPMPP